MKAILRNAYGSADILVLREVDRPSLKDNQLLLNWRM